MRLAVISFTKEGGKWAQTIEERMKTHQEDWEITRYAFWKYPTAGSISFEKGDVLTASIFTQYDGLVFIAAAGIAVRLVAPHVVSKLSDPAVLCIDEQGRFVVSLLSGHIGGANALTRLLADCIAACPVVTTATDAGERFSPDSFAVANRLVIEDMDMAKKIAAAVVAGERIGLFSDYPCGHVPRELVPVGGAAFTEAAGQDGACISGGAVCQDGTCISEEAVPEYGICILKEHREMPFLNTLYLMPKNIILGVGCKRDTLPEVFEAFVLKCLREHGIDINRVCRVCSIDLKKDERAIMDFSEKYRIPFETYSAGTLREVPGEFSASQFVRETTGVDNVCERSAMLYGRELILPKQAGGGVTLAAALAEVKIDFQGSALP